MNQGKMTDLFGEVISSYSRADAIEDGQLIEVDPKICKEAGIILPICVTASLWNFINPEDIEKMPGQSIDGRIWDLLWMFTRKARANRENDRIVFSVIFQMRREINVKMYIQSEIVTVIAVCGPDDRGEPVLTLMLPEDD